MRGGGEKGIGRETSSKAKKNVVESAREREEGGRRGRRTAENGEKRVRYSEEEMRKIPGNEEGKVRGQGRKTG